MAWRDSPENRSGARQEKRSELSWALRSYGRNRGEKERNHRTKGQKVSPGTVPGLYEELVTRRLEAALEEIRGQGWRDEVANLDPAEAPGVLARFVHDLVHSS